MKPFTSRQMGELSPNVEASDNPSIVQTAMARSVSYLRMIGTEVPGGFVTSERVPATLQMAGQGVLLLYHLLNRGCAKRPPV